MAKKEFHHFQFIDPHTGDFPLSVTIMIKRHNLESEECEPISIEDLFKLDESLEKFNGNFIQVFTQNKKNS